MALNKRFLALFAAISIMLGTPKVLAPKALGLVKLDPGSIDMAIRYGLENQGMGLYNILGPNWIEGPEGWLLNVYSPFMLIATQASKKHLPRKPSDKDMKLARKRMARILSRLQDPHEPQKIKFSISMLGDRPDFAEHYAARIEGVGRGRVAEVRPLEDYQDKLARDAGTGGMYEAVNTYYFKYADLENFDVYDLVLYNPDGHEVRFKINNKHIY